MKKLFAVVFFLGAISFWACQKELSYESPTDTASTGAWEFKDSAGKVYSGNSLDYKIDTTLSTTSAQMDYSGVTTSQPQGLLSIIVTFPTRTPATGTYSSALGQVDFNYSVGTTTVYEALSSAQFLNENITVVITQVTDTSVTGTFSGTAFDSTSARTGRVKTIREGKFAFKKRGSSTTPTVPVSAGSLGTSLDTCTGAVVSGTFRKAVAMTSNNTVTVTATVTSTGSYTIYSDTIKGIYFRSTATFTNTGTQSVVVPALGTPTDSGTVRFRLRYGTSACSFQVKIDTSSIAVTPTGDYFPTDAGKNWSYDIYNGSGTQTDSLYVRATNLTRSIGSNTFTTFVDSDSDTSLYRKSGNTYYQAINLDELFASGGVQQTRMLIDTAANSNWLDTYSINYLGFPATATATYSLVGRTASETITSSAGAKTYTDVIKVRVVVGFTLTGGTSTTVTTIDTWYAKGIGVIYSKSLMATVTEEHRLRRNS